MRGLGACPPCHLSPAHHPRFVRAPSLQSGLDSLGSVELRNSLASAFQVELPATLAFDYPTVAAISAHILGHLPAASAAPAAKQHQRARVGQRVARTPHQLQSGRQRSRPAKPHSAAAEVEAAVEAAARELLGADIRMDQPLMEASAGQWCCCPSATALAHSLPCSLFRPAGWPGFSGLCGAAQRAVRPLWAAAPCDCCV